MKLTWLGHACFALEQEGYRIVVDPYAGVEGCPDVNTSAHAVYCSHGHHDHNAVEGVTLLPSQDSPFAVREIAVCHDDQGGALRGKNLIRVFTAGGLSVAHLGDLGHQLSQEQLAAVGTVDAVLVPVGGVYTIDAAGARKVCQALSPRWVIPMHYYSAPYGLPNLAGVEDFLALWKLEQVHRLEEPSLELPLPEPGVWTLKFA